jgi:predicted outer membrane protein
MGERGARRAATAGAALLMAGVVGCGRTPEPRADTTAVATGNLGTRTLNDAQIATLALHLHAVEIGAAQGVAHKLTDERTRVFARAMLAEHAAMDSAMRLLPLQRDTMSQPPAQLATMQAGAHAQTALLTTMPAGTAIDRAYMAGQVATHAQALDSLRRWRTVTRDEGLAASLDAAIARVDVHLAQARTLQTALGGTTDSSAMAPPGVIPLSPERAETPATPLGSQKPDTVTSRLGPPRPDDIARPPTRP